MTRLWVVAAATLVAAAAAAPQDTPAPGKTRLYIGVDPKATLSAPPGERVFSPELELCLASGGTLVGRTEKGVLVIDVPQADKGKATQQVKDTKLAKSVVDVQPAGAGKASPVKRLLVKYKPGEKPTPEQLAAAGLKPIPGKESKAGSFLVVEAPEGVSAETVKKLKGIESVTNAQAERTLRIPPVEKNQGANAPAAKKGGIGAAKAGSITDPYFANGDLWGMKNTHIADVWASGHRKSTVVVAVIDTGIDLDHTDLKGNIWENAAEKNGQPGVDDDGNGHVDDVNGFDFYDMTVKVTDPEGHGTHCAGTIGALANGLGVVGVCHEVKIMPLRFLGPDGGSNADAILCIDYAVEKGAKVISASWGGYGQVPDQFMADAIDRARAKGVLFVAAAGNDGHDNDGNLKHYPSSFGHDNLISVMAVDKSGAIDFGWWKSNFGKTTVHLAAPGHDIWSTVPNNQYAMYSGTSMATPLVAGAAALLYGHQQFATADYKAVRKALIDNVRKDATTSALKDRCTTEGVVDLRFLLAGGKPKP